MLVSWFRRQKGRTMQMVIVLARFRSQAHHFVVKMKIVYINRRMRQDLQWERNSRHPISMRCCSSLTVKRQKNDKNIQYLVMQLRDILDCGSNVQCMVYNINEPLT